MVTMMDTTEREEMATKDTKGKNVRAGEAWIAVRIPDSAKAQLEAFAAEKDLSTSHVARRFLLHVLADRERMAAAL
jgi:hypothetical protein